MAMQHYLEFEKPIEELEKKIRGTYYTFLRHGRPEGGRLPSWKRGSIRCGRKIFSTLSRWQTTQVARHNNRPFTMDYTKLIFTDFIELHGDRNFGDDHAIVGGLARLDGEPVMVIGHQKGRDTKEKVFRNFGMPHPEGYRKALRLMEMAERFKLPIVTLVDTPGASPVSAPKSAVRRRP